MKACVLVGLILGATALNAEAQTRGSIIGYGGPTMMVSSASPAFGIEFEGRTGPHLGWYTGVGRAQDVMPGEIADLLNVVGLTTAGVPISAKIPAMYWVGGVKPAIPAGERTEVYGIVGAGLLHRKVSSFTVAGIDVPVALLEEAAGVELSGTDGLVEIGAGVGVALGRARVDVGYRWNRPLAEGDYSFSRIQFGVGIGF